MTITKNHSTIDTIRLHLNENPHCLPLEVQKKIIQNIPYAHQYHLDYESTVINKLAKVFNLDPKNICITNGVDEAIDQLILTSPTFRIVCAKPGFNAYWSRGHAFSKRCYFLKRKLQKFDLEDSSLAKINKKDLVFLASPDNPTGVELSRPQLEKISTKSGKIFLDKTYEDYQTNRLVHFNNICKNNYYFYSFSKAFCLAGMRLGMLVGEPAEILEIKKRMRFCNIGILPLVSLDAMLDQLQWIQQRVIEINHEKERVFSKLSIIGYNILMTQTNFLLLKTEKSNDLQKELLKRKILVKDTSVFGLNNHLRITIGLLKQNDLLIATLHEIKYQNEYLNGRLNEKRAI